MATEKGGEGKRFTTCVATEPQNNNGSNNKIRECTWSGSTAWQTGTVP